MLFENENDFLSAEGEGGGREDTWMGDLWFAERKAHVPKLLRAKPKHASGETACREKRGRLVSIPIE